MDWQLIEIVPSHVIAVQGNSTPDEMIALSTSIALPEGG
jgi:hypothetical protein